ncbi:MAG: hydrogenase nickel incorporation protein HypB [Cyanobium sp.]
MPVLSAPSPSSPPSRRVALARRLLERNDLQAVLNRTLLRQAGVLALNLLSSPGSGKTSLLEALARWTPTTMRQAVIVGDLATDHDARRLQAAGLPAIQISTGQGCHLEASQVASAIERLVAAGPSLSALDLLWIENVGNLVCPAAYDLGESGRVVLLAAGEGEDKPLKYPALFHTADLVLISKIDLATAVDFDRDAAHRAISRVAPRARVLEISARSGRGLPELLDLLNRWSATAHAAPQGQGLPSGGGAAPGPSPCR